MGFQVLSNIKNVGTGEGFMYYVIQFENISISLFKNIKNGISRTFIIVIYNIKKLKRKLVFAVNIKKK